MEKKSFHKSTDKIHDLHLEIQESAEHTFKVKPLKETHIESPTTEEPEDKYLLHVVRSDSKTNLFDEDTESDREYNIDIDTEGFQISFYNEDENKEVSRLTLSSDFTASYERTKGSDLHEVLVDIDIDEDSQIAAAERSMDDVLDDSVPRAYYNSELSQSTPKTELDNGHVETMLKPNDIEPPDVGELSQERPGSEEEKRVITVFRSVKPKEKKPSEETDNESTATDDYDVIEASVTQRDITPNLKTADSLSKSFQLENVTQKEAPRVTLLHMARSISKDADKELESVDSEDSISEKNIKLSFTKKATAHHVENFKSQNHRGLDGQLKDEPEDVEEEEPGTTDGKDRHVGSMNSLPTTEVDNNDTGFKPELYKVKSLEEEKIIKKQRPSVTGRIQKGIGVVWGKAQDYRRKISISDNLEFNHYSEEKEDIVLNPLVLDPICMGPAHQDDHSKAALDAEKHPDYFIIELKQPKQVNKPISVSEDIIEEQSTEIVENEVSFDEMFREADGHNPTDTFEEQKTQIVKVVFVDIKTDRIPEEQEDETVESEFDNSKEHDDSNDASQKPSVFYRIKNWTTGRRQSKTSEIDEMSTDSNNVSEEHSVAGVEHLSDEVASQRGLTNYTEISFPDRPQPEDEEASSALSSETERNDILEPNNQDPDVPATYIKVTNAPRITKVTVKSLPSENSPPSSVTLTVGTVTSTVGLDDEPSDLTKPNLAWADREPPQDEEQEANLHIDDHIDIDSKSENFNEEFPDEEVILVKRRDTITGRIHKGINKGVRGVKDRTPGFIRSTSKKGANEENNDKEAIALHPLMLVPAQANDPSVDKNDEKLSTADDPDEFFIVEVKPPAKKYDLNDVVNEDIEPLSMHVVESEMSVDEMFERADSKQKQSENDNNPPPGLLSRFRSLTSLTTQSEDDDSPPPRLLTRFRSLTYLNRPGKGEYDSILLEPESVTDDEEVEIQTRVVKVYRKIIVSSDDTIDEEHVDSPVLPDEKEHEDNLVSDKKTAGLVGRAVNWTRNKLPTVMSSEQKSNLLDSGLTRPDEVEGISGKDNDDEPCDKIKMSVADEVILRKPRTSVTGRIQKGVRGVWGKAQSLRRSTSRPDISDSKDDGSSNEPVALEPLQLIPVHKDPNDNEDTKTETDVPSDFILLEFNRFTQGSSLSEVSEDEILEQPIETVENEIPFETMFKDLNDKPISNGMVPTEEDERCKTEHPSVNDGKVNQNTTGENQKHGILSRIKSLKSAKPKFDTSETENTDDELLTTEVRVTKVYRVTVASTDQEPQDDQDTSLSPSHSTQKNTFKNATPKPQQDSKKAESQVKPSISDIDNNIEESESTPHKIEVVSDETILVRRRPTITGRIQKGVRGIWGKANGFVRSISTENHLYQDDDSHNDETVVLSPLFLRPIQVNASGIEDHNEEFQNTDVPSDIVVIDLMLGRKRQASGNVIEEAIEEHSFNNVKAELSFDEFFKNINGETQSTFNNENNRIDSSLPITDDEKSFNEADRGKVKVYRQINASDDQTGEQMKDSSNSSADDADESDLKGNFVSKKAKAGLLGRAVTWSLEKLPIVGR